MQNEVTLNSPLSLGTENVQDSVEVTQFNPYLIIVILNVLTLIIPNVLSLIFGDITFVRPVLQLVILTASAPLIWKLLKEKCSKQKGHMIAVVVVLMQPLILLLIHYLEWKTFWGGLNLKKLFLSQCLWLSHAAMIFVMVLGLRKSDYLKLIKGIWLLGMFMGIEAILVNAFFYDTEAIRLFYTKDYRYLSLLIRDNFLTGIMGLQLVGLSYYYWEQKLLKNSGILGILLGCLLLVLCMERSILIGFLTFCFLLFLTDSSRKKIILGGVIAALCASTFLLFKAKKSANYMYEPHSLYERIIRYGRAGDLIYDSFPIGLGSGSAVKYQYDPRVNDVITRKMVQNAPALDTLRTQFYKIYFRISDSMGFSRWESLHSTWLELIVDLGLIGLMIVGWCFWFPIRYFYQRFFGMRDRQAAVFNRSTDIAALILIATYIPLAFITVGHHYISYLAVPFIGLYFVHFFQQNQKI